MADHVTAQVLRGALAILKEDGWAPNGHGPTPPFNIRQAVRMACAKQADGHRSYVAAINAIATAMGSPIGAIGNWEAFQSGKNQDSGPVKYRTQAEAEALLEEAISWTGSKEVA